MDQAAIQELGLPNSFQAVQDQVSRADARGCRFTRCLLMAWDFSAEPDFEVKLDWVRAFVASEIEPLDLVFSKGVARYRSHPVFERHVRPLQQQVKDHGLWACHLGPELGGLGYGQVKLALL